jgi:cytochrome o ubiquinol oxidase subunit 2
LLGAITWTYTVFGPVPPISRIDAKRVVPEGTKPLVVEVVALVGNGCSSTEQGIALVNELAAPIE